MEREALVIGINRYPLLIDALTRQKRHLQTSALDAETIAHVLEVHGNFRVRRLPETYDSGGNSIIAPKGLVHPEQLKTAIENLFNPPSQTVPETALLFFAGHGLRREYADGAETFLATSDACPEVGDFGLPLSWLRHLLQNSPVRQQIVWLDCCYSGELFNFEESVFQRLGTHKNRCLIAASRDFEQAYEAFGGTHGLLAGALIEGLDPAHWSDGYVTNYTLVDFVKKHLKTAPQSPRAYNFGGEIILTGVKEKIDPLLLKQVPCPYKGLEAFEIEDASFFFGRTRLVEELCTKLAGKNFLAVVGASGSGKSSIVKAGLLPELRRRQREQGVEPWLFQVFRPGTTPLKNLARVFAEASLDLELSATEALVYQGANGLAELVRSTDSPGVVLVVDQFEEVFSLCSSHDERQRFFECLLGALNAQNTTFELPTSTNQGKALPLIVVLTMRADFFGKCLEQEYAGLPQLIQDHLAAVTPMNLDELRATIVQPAMRVGVEVQPELIEQILEDVEGPGSLPLLQYTLQQLWENREVNRLTVAEYSRVGGVKGALEQRAEAVYNEELEIDRTGERLTSTEEQQTAQRIFLELTQLGEGTEDTRRQVLKEDLFGNDLSIEHVEHVDSVLQKLTDARLLVTSELKSRSDMATTVTAVDVAHEALIRYWPRLRGWIAENRQALKQKRLIENDAQQWEGHGRQSDYLLQGLQLDEVIEFQERFGKTIRLLEPAPEFVDKSIRKRRNTKLTRRIIGASVAASLAALSIIASWQAVSANKEAARAKEQQELAVERQKEAQAFAEESQKQEKKAEAALADAELARNEAEKALKTAEDEKKKAQIEKARADQSAKAAQKRRQEAESARLAEAEQRQRAEVAQQQAERRRQEAEGAKTEAEAATAKAEAERSNTEVLADSLRAGKIFEDLSLEIESLIKALEVAQQVQPSQTGEVNVPQMAAVTALQRIVYNIKERNRLEGHTSGLWDVSFSPNGQLIASAGDDDKTVRLWDRNGNLLEKLDHDNPVGSVSFSPDSQIIVSAETNGTIRLWNRDGLLLRDFVGERGFNPKSVSFSPDGQLIVTGGNDKTVKIWTRYGDLKQTLAGHDDYVNDVSFSPDGQLIASAGGDKVVKLWTRDGNLLKTLEGHSAGLWSVSFSPDSQLIASASADRTVKIWTRDGELLQTLTGHSEAITSVSFSPNSQLIASVSKDRTVRVWHQDGSNWTSLEVLEGHEDFIWGVSFSPDSQTIASAGADKTVRLWELDNTGLNTLDSYRSSVFGVDFSSDGQSIAAGSYDGILKLWAHGGQEDAITFVDEGNENTHKNGKAHEKAITRVRFNPIDDQTIINDQTVMLASASRDGTVKLWNHKGNLLRTLGHNPISDANGYLNSGGREVKSVSFSPDGQIIASAGTDNTIKLWNLEGRQLEAFASRLKCNFSGDGHCDYVNSISFSPDGQHIASASGDDTIKVWDLNGNLLHTLEGHTKAVVSVDFSPNSPILASASDDETIKLWNTKDGNLLQTLRGHSEGITSVKFSPNGETIVSASWDRTLKIWDLAGNELATIEAHKGAVWDIAFSPDSQIIASAGGDAVVKLWYLNFDSLIGQGCNWLGDYLINHAESLMDLEICHVTLKSRLRDAAPELVKLGRQAAKAGNLKDAEDKFRQALQWDTRIDLDPYTKDLDRDPIAVARQVFAPTKAREARRLAEQGDLKGAITTYHEALTLDPQINLNGYRGNPDTTPDASIGKLVAPVRVKKASELARQGDLEGAIALYNEAIALDPDIDLAPHTKKLDSDPIALVQRLAAYDKALEGRSLARNGDVEGAIAAFNEALEIDSTIELHSELESNDPVAAARRSAASPKWYQGRNLAREGNLEQAILAFREALELDPDIDLDDNIESNDPAVVARRIAASEKVREGRDLVRYEGDLEGAIISYQSALEIDSTIDLDEDRGDLDNDPVAVAHQVAALYKVETGRNRAEYGNVEGAIALFREALAIYPT
ncbi:MAG: hypothetical protein F6K19_31715, partial [Cyanothece sp. SIO1E1]|nr:hypothetical protein [Cyanothece sp. SIO1E1]